MPARVASRAARGSQRRSSPLLYARLRPRTRVAAVAATTAATTTTTSATIITIIANPILVILIIFTDNLARNGGVDGGS